MRVLERSAAGDTEAERERIAPVPRISLQAFCETPELAGVINESCADRRMDKAHAKVHMGGAPARVEFIVEQPSRDGKNSSPCGSASALTGIQARYRRRGRNFRALDHKNAALRR